MCRSAVTQAFAPCCLIASMFSWFPSCGTQIAEPNEQAQTSGGQVNSDDDSNSSSPKSGLKDRSFGGASSSLREATPPASGGTPTTPASTTDGSVEGGASTRSTLGGSGGTAPASNTDRVTTTATDALAPLCGTFPNKPNKTGTLFQAGTEASGLVASRKQPGVYWMHGDNGANLYAIDTTGKLLGQWEVTSSARFFFIYNWEDIAIEATSSGPDRIWIGDIGNHTEDAEGNPVEPRANLRLLSIDEPSVDPSQVLSGEAPVLSDLEFPYPDGIFDSEALVIDPSTNDAFVISKTAEPPCKIYRIQSPYDTGSLQYIGSLDADSINAADISASGRELIAHNYLYVYYWTKGEGQSWLDILSAEPSVPASKGRLQFTQNYFAEAVGFSQDESGFYVVSEEQPGVTTPSAVEFYPKSCQ